MRSIFAIVSTLLILVLMATYALSAPIHDAASKDNVAKVKALLKKNPKLLNVRDKDQSTPLHYAVASGKTGVLKFLLSKNAQVNLKRNDGATPLHVAVATGQNNVVALLKQKGAKADLSNIVVVFPKGAIIMRNGKKIAGVQKGAMIKVSDIISTGTKGNMDLIVGSVAAVRVRPSTRIRIQKAENNKGRIDVKIRLGQGTMLTRLRKLTGQSRFILETPGAVAAARGTAYMTRYENNTTEVLVAEGKVAVSLTATPTQEVDVGASQKIAVDKELPVAPTEMTESDTATVNELLSVNQPPPPELRAGDESINPIDSAVMVWVPSGWFQMGANINDAYSGLMRKVYLDGYWIYKHEVTVAQYQAFCLESGKEMAPAPSWGWSIDHPIVNISWFDMADYAKWAGVSLPTEAQWEKAARGTDGRIYPWGNIWDPTKCNEVTIGPKRTQPVGSYPAGASPYGCMDMAGNVIEWCADWYAKDYDSNAPVKNPSGPADGIFRVMRGGTWHFSFEGDFRSFYRFPSNIDPTNRTDDLGFRCTKTQ